MISWPKPEPSLPDPPGVTVPAWLVSAAKFASWIAMACLVMFLGLYVLDIARDRAGELHITHAGTWVGSVSFWFPYIIPFALVAFGIPYVAKIALPTFMALDWRTNLWAKLWALLIAVAVSAVVIAGTFTVQGNTLMERDRDAAVAVEQVQQGRAVLEARIGSKRAELTDMMNNSNAYLAQAASVGALEWERTYIAQARGSNDYRLPMLERALGAARAADTLRAEIETLRGELAAAPAVASVQREIVTERTGWVADLLGWLEGARAILLSLVMDIVALIMPWIALRLEQARAVQLAMYGLERKEPDASTMIPDFRNEAPVAEEPMDAGFKGDSIYDENGRELRWTAGFVRKKDGKWIPGHYRPTGNRQKQEIEVEYEGRSFKTNGAEEVSAAVEHDSYADRSEGHEGEQEQNASAGEKIARDEHAGEAGDDDNGEENAHNVVISDNDLAILAALETPVDEVHADEAGDDGAEPDQQGEHIALPANEGMMIAQGDDPNKVAAE